MTTITSNYVKQSNPVVLHRLRGLGDAYSTSLDNDYGSSSDSGGGSSFWDNFNIDTLNKYVTTGSNIVNTVDKTVKNISSGGSSGTSQPAVNSGVQSQASNGGVIIPPPAPTKKGLSTGAIIGIVAAGVALLGGSIYVATRDSKKKGVNGIEGVSKKKKK